MKVPGFDMSLDEVKASLEPLRRPLSIAFLRARIFSALRSWASPIAAAMSVMLYL